MAAPKKTDLQGELGRSGTAIVGGVISNQEYNRDVKGRQGLKVYDEMRRSDGTVKASLLAVKLPILSVKWSMRPASDDAADVAIADFVTQNLFESLNFDVFLRQALTCLDFGFSVFEKVFEPITWNGGTFIGLTKLSPRLQTSIFKWETQDVQPGVTQLVSGQPNASIPKEKLLVLTHDQEGDNFEGISILRGAYQHWYIKKTLYKIDAIAHERQALGVPILRTPALANETDKSRARELARNQRANEEAYLELPEGFDFEFLDMKAKTTRDILPSIMHQDRQIIKNVLAQFLDIGSQGSSGSYAASADQSRLFELSLEAVAKSLASAINEQVVKLLVDLNYTTERYPKVVFDRIGDENLELIAEALQKLSGGGLLSPDPDLEQYLREMYHLPGLPEEIREDYANRQVAKSGASVTATDKLDRARVVRAELLAEINQRYEADDARTT